MDELAQRSPEAAEHLAVLDPTLQEEIGHRVLALSHETLFTSTPGFEEAKITPVPTLEHDEAQKQEYDRMGQLMVGVSRLTGAAYQELSSSSIERPTHKEILAKAKEIALAEAEAARQADNAINSEAAIGNYLLLGLLDERDHHDEITSHKDVQRAVEKGFAKEVISAASELSGVVTIGKYGHVADTPSRLEQSADLLRIAANEDFDDRFDHRVPLVAPGTSNQDVLHSREIVNRLGFSDLHTLAKLASDTKHSARALYFSQKALDKVNDPYGISRFQTSGVEVADTIVIAQEAASAAKDERAVSQLVKQLDVLRSARAAGLKPYRINTEVPAILDEAVIMLIRQGRYDEAKSLISASSHDSAKLDDPPEANKDYNLEYAASYNLDGLSEHEKEELIQKIRSLHAEKVSEFQSSLLSDGASHEIISAILDETADPESAIGTPRSVWAIYHTLPNSLKDMLTGTHAVSVAEHGSLIEDAKRAGVDFHFISERIFRSYAKLIPAGRGVYMSGLKYVSDVEAELQPEVKLLNPTRIIEEFSFFADPAEALKLARKMFGDQALEKAPLLEMYFSSSLSANPVNDADRQPATLVPEHKEILEYIATQPEFLHELFTSDAFIEFVRNSSSLDEAHELVAALSIQEFTELFAIPGMTGLLAKHLLDTEDMMASAQEMALAWQKTGFTDLIGPNGAGFQLASGLINSVLQAKDSVQMAQQIVSIFEGGGSLWHTSSELALLTIESGFYTTSAEVKRLPTSLPLRSTTTYRPEAISYASGPELRELLGLYGLSESKLGEIEAAGWKVALSDLPADLQHTVLSAYLYEAITRSRDLEIRSQAEQRNSEIDSSAVWQHGSLHHFTNPETLYAILQNGLLPGELVIDHMRPDSFPFNLDVVEATAEVLKEPDHASRISKLASHGYGALGIHILRPEGTYREGEEFAVGSNYSGQHRLIAGGLPSTEIAGLTLSDTTQLPLLRNAILESGFYIPVFDTSGTLIFTYEEYQSVRRDMNYDTVRPDIVDTTFERPQSQTGSNEGAEFIVPSSETGGETVRYYCKFAQPGNEDHIWIELLTDRLYRTVTPELVPETIPVVLEGRLARASKYIDADEVGVTDTARNEGFIMDCLVGNWDATFNAANLLMSQGHGQRIDNGNSLWFRARGERKPDGSFTETVNELENGSSSDSLGLGMRQNYPGLSVAEIKQQASTLEEQLTDEVIDGLVDGIRLASSERAQLKRLLKGRRDYIVSWAEQLELNAVAASVA